MSYLNYQHTSRVVKCGLTPQSKVDSHFPGKRLQMSSSKTKTRKLMHRTKELSNSLDMYLKSQQQINKHRETSVLRQNRIKG